MFYVYQEDFFHFYYIYEELLPEDMMDGYKFIKAFDTREEAEKFVDYVEHDEYIKDYFQVDGYDYLIETF